MYCRMHIVEIVRRCSFEQGVLQPFLCLAEDGNYYFAKGSNSTVIGLVTEWCSARLAQTFGLPTPEPDILYMDPLLKEISEASWQVDLELEHLFGSRSVQPCETLTLSDLHLIPVGLQRDIFVFDYWINNSDRNIGAAGGNVNLLLESVSQQLQVIDFNLAFSSNFSLDEMELHVFRDAIARKPIDLDSKARYLSKMDLVRKEFELIVSQIPEEWFEFSESANTTLEHIRKTLDLADKDEFWSKIT